MGDTPRTSVDAVKRRTLPSRGRGVSVEGDTTVEYRDHVLGGGGESIDE